MCLPWFEIVNNYPNTQRAARIPTLSSKVVQLCWQCPNQSDSNFAKVAEFKGASIEQIALSSEFEAIGYLQSLPNDDATNCVVAGSRTLAHLSKKRDRRTFFETLSEKVTSFFAYGFSPCKTDAEVLIDLTEGLLTNVEYSDRPCGSFRVSSQARDFCCQFSGLELGSVNARTDFIFVSPRQSVDLTKLVTIGGKPFFVELKRRKSRMFLVATNDVIDIDEPASPTVPMSSWFSALLPTMMFLRFACGDQCWHNDRSYATLIIDDPLLRERYGFLKYRDLLFQMERNDFSTAIAFIPWNCRRSDESIATLFRQKPNKLSLCIHGNDHSHYEFGGTVPRGLQWKALEAQRRMKLHEKLTRVPFDDVMVFPQGVFSAAAMRALKVTNYLCAVNSSPYCLEATDNAIKLRDMLDVAIMQYHAFPLFVRHYPRDISEFALDLFLGRPAFIVEHHDWFRNGFEEILNFIARVQRLEVDILWKSLGEAVSNTYLQRRVDCRSVQAKFYSSRVFVRNGSSQSQNYILLKKEIEGARIAGVRVDGINVPFELKNGFITLEVMIGARGRSSVEVRYEDSLPVESGESKGSERIKVFIRRHLSEARDNYLSKNKALLKLTKKVKRYLPTL